MDVEAGIRNALGENAAVHDRHFLVLVNGVDRSVGAGEILDLDARGRIEQQTADPFEQSRAQQQARDQRRDVHEALHHRRSILQGQIGSSSITRRRYSGSSMNE